MICRRLFLLPVPQELGTELFKTEKFTFQDIALCSANDYPFVYPDLPT
jgi:hypothetical protein